MIFSAQLGNSSSQQQFVISANTWSSCLAYCEGTGLDIISISISPKVTLHYNVTGTNCYQVSCQDAQGDLVNILAWETDFNTLSAWMETQGYYSVRVVQQSNKTYVVV